MSEYKTSFYSQTRNEEFEADPMVSDSRTDVCVIGGGIAGLSCAQKLVEAGSRVVLVERGRLFSGASGLNGGFVSAGYALAMPHVEARVGLDTARALFDLTVAGVSAIDLNIKQLGIASAGQTRGKLVLLRHTPSVQERGLTETMSNKYGYTVKPVERAQLRDLLASNAYQYGLLHEDAFHLHPLNYGLALARSLQQQGLTILENERVSGIKCERSGYRVQSSSGTIRADQVVVSTGGYASGEVGKLKRATLPITTYAAISEPNDAIPEKYIKTNYAIGDSRRASDYYRIVNGNQLLWGGRITAFPTHNIERIKFKIRHDILKSYPDMEGLRLKTAWSGVMGYASHKMPYIGQLPNGIWYCTAFGGHGLGTGTAGGRIVADAMLGKSRDIDLFRAFPLRPTFGLLGRLAVEATYKKYIMTDFLKEWRAA